MIFLIGAIVVGGGVLASCSTKDTKESTSELPNQMSMMAESELTSLDSGAMQDFPDAITHTAAFEGLYVLNDQDEAIPAVAKEMPEISEDGKGYTVQLREDATWSNGDPVTAHDFEQTWKRVCDPTSGYVYSFIMQENIKNGKAIATGEMAPNELGVKAVNDYTLVIELEEPKPYFTSLMTFPVFLPQNQSAVKEFGKEYGTSSEKVVYNGPYLVKNWKQSEMAWDLEKNDNYWDKKHVSVDKIHYEVVKDSSTAVNLYKDGQLDIAYLSGNIAQMNQENPDYQSYPTATLNYIRINQERKGKPTPLANEYLRKALALGIDKETLVNHVIADGSVPLDGFITKGFVKNPETKKDFREDAGKLMSYDPKKAADYWKKAQAELGEKIELDFMVTDSESYKKLAESIQGNLEQKFKGLTINVRSLPTEAALNMARESDYDLFLIYWTPDYQDAISTLNMMHSDNAMHYHNQKYDQMLDQASTILALQPEQRWQTLIDAEKEVIENTAGTIVISQNQQTVLQNPQIEGVKFHTFGSPLSLKNLRWK